MNQRLKPILRGDIYYADLSPAIGSEQDGIRPVLILQNNMGNRYSPTVIVAAITSRPKKCLPTHVEIGGTKGVQAHSVALLEQLRTIDRARLRERVGRLDKISAAQIDEALKISIGLAPALSEVHRLEEEVCREQPPKASIKTSSRW